MKLGLITIMIIIIFAFFACQKDEESKIDKPASSMGHEVKVLTVVQANSYTYLEVEEGDKEYWMATGKTTSIEEDAILYFTRALEMKNFKSEDLDRTFDTIYFVQEISDKPIKAPHGMPAKSVMKRKSSKKDESISIEPVSGGLTITELYGNSAFYSDKQVKIKGRVTKFNPSIMGKNWVHIQDGSEHGGKYDLTITTQSQVKVGDVVVFEGIISLNKDFGSGYFYEIIMEEAQLLDNETVVL